MSAEEFLVQRKGETFTQEKASSLFAEVCGNFLLYQKNSGLYPQDHPRVQKSLETIKDAIFRYYEETRRPFYVDSKALTEIAEEDVAPQVVTLKGLFRAHFIESVTIHPNVTRGELSEIVFLLQEEDSETDEISFNPEKWKDVVITFYLPQEFLEVDAAGNLTEQARGVRKIKNLKSLLKGLPENVQESLQKALLKPSLIGKIGSLRKSLKGQLGISDGDTGGLDLLSEIICSVSESDHLAQRSQEEIAATLEELLDFMESNVGRLSPLVESYPDQSNPQILRRQIREVIQHGFELSEQVNNIQTLKERLSFLFQIAPGTDRIVGNFDEIDVYAEDRPPISDASSTAAERFRNKEEASLAAKMTTISYDPGELKKEIEQLDTDSNYLHINLEFLSRETYQPKVREKWNTIIGLMREASEKISNFEQPLSTITAFLGDVPESEAVDLALIYLKNQPVLETTRATLETFAEIPSGRRLIEPILDGLFEDGADKVVPLLTRLSASEQKLIRSIASSRLLNLALKPEILARWASEDPKGLCDPEILRKLLNKLNSHQLRLGFRRVFSTIKLHLGIQILDCLPPSVPEAEEILFVAIDSCREGIRARAISNLSKYPTAVVISLLISILNHNNYKKLCTMWEVKVALEALVKVDNPKAKRFVNDVLTKKRWFRYVYRKEIRRTLSKF